jgi:hypothetical protein
MLFPGWPPADLHVVDLPCDSNFGEQNGGRTGCASSHDGCTRLHSLTAMPAGPGAHR